MLPAYQGYNIKLGLQAVLRGPIINHLAANGVAPVDKTVTYSTVTGIPGEPTKCWITSNLGASQQATAETLLPKLLAAGTGSLTSRRDIGTTERLRLPGILS